MNDLTGVELRLTALKSEISYSPVENIKPVKKNIKKRSLFSITAFLLVLFNCVLGIAMQMERD